MKTPKHQKGSEIRTKLEAQIGAGSLSRKEERKLQKALKYIDDNVFYFRNADGTYSTFKEDPTKAATATTAGTTTTVDPDKKPELQQVTSPVGIRNSSAKISGHRLGLGKNKGARKVANAIGAAGSLGILQTYNEYMNPAKKEETKKESADGEGFDSELTSEQAKLANAEQDALITTDIANIKEADVKYRTVTQEEAEAMYDNISDLDTVPGSDGSNNYKVPYAMVGSGATKEAFSLKKGADGKYEINSPMANISGEGGSAEIESKGKKSAPTFAGGDNKDYQEYLAKLLAYKKETGDLDDADVTTAGLKLNDLFNAKGGGEEREYSEILNQINSKDDQVNSDETGIAGNEGFGSGQQVQDNAGPDGQFGTEDDYATDPVTKLKTRVDGQLGGATEKLEKLLGITTRPSNLTQSKKTGTGSGGGSGSGKTGGDGGAADLKSLIKGLNDNKGSIAASSGIGTTTTQRNGGILYKKKGGRFNISFSILNKK